MDKNTKYEMEAGAYIGVIELTSGQQGMKESLS